ncbi:MAG TPA: ABC transporter permease [Thermoanaerobaculia bacterium]|nr:ABC transporter permease [Thermoanaerobaculia bacterium]
MDGFLQDLRLAGRTMRRNPGFAFIVVLTLGLGIGANAAIFSLMDQVLLRALPVQDPARLVLVSGPGARSGRTSSHTDDVVPLSQPMLAALRRETRVFEAMAGFYLTSLNVGVGRDTAQAEAEIVTGDYFRVLGVRPAVGRVLGASDDATPGGHPVVVLSHAYWMRRFGGDPSIVGTPVHVNGQPMTVVGVAARGFLGSEVGRSADLFAPAAMKAAVTPGWNGLGEWHVYWLHAIARLAPGFTRESALPQVNVVYARALVEDAQRLTSKSKDFRERFLAKKLVLLPGGSGTSGLRRQFSTPLIVLMGMVGLVLLIACANVANLLLARSAARQRDIAVRLAIGAGRGHLVRQLLVESAVLGLLGAAAGIGFASVTSKLLLRAVPLSGAPALSSAVDARVTLFALGAGLVTTLLFGLAPALSSTRPSLSLALRAGAGNRVAGSPARFRRGLVVAQVALSLLLLIGAGLFVRSLKNLLALDPGFVTERVLTFTVDPALSGMDTARGGAFFVRLRESIAHLPGVSSVSMARIGLLTGDDSSSTVKIEGYEAREQEDMNPNVNQVGTGFFETLGMRLVSGRELDDRDSASARNVAVVNEAFARSFFKGESTIGRRFGWGRAEKGFDVEIVGVVRDGKEIGLRSETHRLVYTPLAQAELPGRATYYVRAVGPPAALASSLRHAVAQADPGVPVTDMKTMESQVDESLFTERLVAGLSAAFGLLATLLAAVGLYGVTSWSVAQRTQEIGLRMALGAQRRNVLSLILGEVGMLTGLGIAAGLPAALVLAYLVRSQLFGVSSADPLTILASTATLALVTLLAGFLPARRAMRVEPLVALRYE